jgi:CubicO group peptidase (beta-lactamase class C family)
MHSDQGDQSDQRKVSRRSFLVRSAMTWAAASLTSSLVAAANWKAAADRTVQSMMQDHGIPGVMLAVVKGGQVGYQKAYGVKRMPNGGAPDAETVFHIGSLSKAITAVGAMVLVQNGKLDLNAPASQYIKELPRKWHDITVKQFMTHTSGIPEIGNKKKNAQESIAGVYQLMADMPMQSKPGTKQVYNNFNFAVTGNLIEVISGMSFIDYMTAHVFEPLQMNRTGIGDIDPNNHAFGYRQNKKGVIETEPDTASFGIPSGGLETTLSDLLKLEASFRAHTLLKPRFFKMMITPIDGFDATPGWFSRKAGGTSVISKNGAAGGFSSFFTFVPDRGDALIMLRNFQGDGAGIQGPSNDILAGCCGIPKHGGGEEGDND